MTDQQPEARPKEPTPAEKTRLKTGKCIAVAIEGTCTCEGYMFQAHVDGFDTCVCGHTQVAHTSEQKEEAK